jgi:hypothetical protein
VSWVCVTHPLPLQVTGWLPKPEMRTALGAFFSHKCRDRLGELLEALDADERGDSVHYQCLFEDDGNMDQGAVVEAIRAQFLTERLDYLLVGGLLTESGLASDRLLPGIDLQCSG